MKINNDAIYDICLFQNIKPVNIFPGLDFLRLFLNEVKFLFVLFLFSFYYLTSLQPSLQPPHLAFCRQLSLETEKKQGKGNYSL